jgi:hypothetical protein
MEQVNEKNTKKEIFDAYRELLQKVESGHQPALVSVADGGVVEDESQQKKKTVSVDIVDTLSNLHTMIADTLAAFSRQAAEFRKCIKEEEEVFSHDMQTKRDAWRREEEEYQYATKMKHRQEEDDYHIKTREKERQFNESITVKKHELEEREQQIKLREGELTGLKKQVDLFPTELKKAVDEAVNHVRSEVQRDSKVSADLIAKDAQRERELSKLTTQGLEETIKRQTAYITNLERQLAQAVERAQRLAVTVIEGSSRKGDVMPEAKEMKSGTVQ